MTASLVRMPGTGDLLVPEACQRTLEVFDGRLRYDMQFAFKRMERVKAEKGYAGPVVVCAVYFSPVAGFIPSRTSIKYLSKQRDMEIWLAPIAGTRVLVPYRAQGPYADRRRLYSRSVRIRLGTDPRAGLGQWLKTQ